jgi:hypothetical protein
MAALRGRPPQGRRVRKQAHGDRIPRVPLRRQGPPNGTVPVRTGLPGLRAARPHLEAFAGAQVAGAGGARVGASQGGAERLCPA